MQPKLSIIIPVYNGEPYLKKCIESVLRQSLQEFEIIIIDDSSIDKSSQLIRNIQKHEKRIQFIQLKSNKGPGFCRNLALRKAKGRYIMFLDSDDWLEPNAMEQLFLKASKRNSEIVLFGNYNFDEKIKLQSNKEAIIPTLNVNDPNIFTHCLLTTKGLRAMPWGYIFNRNYLKRNKIFFSEGIYFEDVIFTLKSIYFSSRVDVLKKPLYNYRIHKDSITNSCSKKKIDDCFSAHLQIKSFLQSQKIYEKHKNEFIIRFLSCCLSLCFMYYFMLPRKKRTQELKEFMTKCRKSHMMHSRNILQIKKIFLKLVSEQEKNERIFFENAFNFLSTIKYRYWFVSGFYTIKRFLIYNLNFTKWRIA